MKRHTRWGLIAAHAVLVAVAVVLVEQPLRLARWLWVRHEVPLRVELAVWRLAYRFVAKTRTAGVAVPVLVDSVPADVVVATVEAA